MNATTVKGLVVKPLPEDLIVQLRPIIEALLAVGPNVKVVKSARQDQLAIIKGKIGPGPALRFVTVFAGNSPLGIGIERRRKWWRMMLHVFSFGEVLERYFNQIPKDLTSYQREHLHQYLVKKVGLDSGEAELFLKRFGNKPSDGRRRRDRRGAHLPAHFMA